MSWTTPATYTDGAVLTGAQLNLSRDNFNETAPGKATTAGRIFVATGANSIAERAIESSTVTTAEATASLSYTALATPGPAVTVTTGTRALLLFVAQALNTSVGGQSFTGWTVSGATTVAENDDDALVTESGAASDVYRVGAIKHVTGLTAGSNIFTLKYKVSTGTSTFSRRHIVVIGL